MQQVWNYLIPSDQYTVMCNGVIHPNDLKLVTFLYQPLIGLSAAGLYHSFWQESALFDSPYPSTTHHSLVAKIRLPLKQFYQERKKLEAIGLLKTYQKENEERREFIYELQPPLSPAQFFDDGMLNVYLYNQVGRSYYLKLKKMFISEARDEQFTDVTAAFNTVFSSFQPSELSLSHEAQMDLGLSQNQVWDDRKESPGLVLDSHSFPFDLLFQTLSDVILPKEAFTEEVKDAIAKLSFVYHIAPEEMGQIIQRAFLHDAQIDVVKLRKEVQKYYRIELGGELPALSERRQPLPWQEMAHKEPKTEEERLIAAFEKMSPYELLELLGDGSRPPAPDLKVIEEIMFEQKLPPGVMNVLIHYVMETNDQKLVKAYMEKIAGHWARKKIKAVREAMVLARSEHRKYQEWSQKKQSMSQSGNGRVRNQRKEKLPKWLTEPKKTAEVSQDEASKQEEWLENYLKDI